MKAVPFLEYVIQQPQFVSYYDGKATITDFYSQEFKPEMIVEYFEGFGKDKWASNTFYKGDEGFEYRIGFDEDNRIRYHKNKSCQFYREEMPVPATLDLFITDCQRAGIELVWKESIEEKYFK